MKTEGTLYKSRKSIQASAVSFFAAATLVASATSDVNAQANSSSRVPVISSSSLTGEEVHDSAGGVIGTIEYVLVDANEGVVRHVIVDRKDGEGAQFSPIPYAALNVSSTAPEWFLGDNIAVTVERKSALEAPKFTSDDLNNLTRPAMMVEVVDYWAPLVERNSRPNNAAPNKQSNAQGNKSAGQSPSDTQAGRQSGAQGATGSASQSIPHMLVGRQQITTLLPPRFRLGSDIEGAIVENAEGEEVGEIEDVVIDRATGQIAYVLVAEDQFLGVGEDVRPIPMTALQHSADKNTYRMKIATEDLARTRTLRNAATPSSVRRSDLQELYQSYGVPPYWMASDRTKATDKQ